MSSTDPNPGPTPGAWADSTGDVGAGGDVLRMLQEVEAQLEHLRQAEQRQREMQQTLEERAKSLEDRERLAEEARTALESDRRTLETELEELRQRREAFDAQAREAEERSAALSQSESDSASRAEEVSRRLAEVEDREREIGERAESLQAKASEIDERARALEGEASDIAGQLDRVRTEMEHQERAAEEATRERDELRDEAQRNANDLQVTRDQLERLKEAYKEQARRAAEAANAEELTEELAELRNERERLASELEAHQAQHEREHQETCAERDRLATELEALRATQHELEPIRAETERLTAALEEAQTQHERALGELRSERDRLAGELEAHRDQIGGDERALHERVDYAVNAERERLAKEFEADRERAEREFEVERERMGREFRAERDRLESEVRAAMHAAEHGGKQPASNRGGSERAERRRHRLMRYRSAVTARARKLRVANEVLRERIAQCDGLLSQRRELAAAKRAIDETRGRVEAARARTSASAVTFFMLATVIMLGGISWLITGHFAPATYTASARLAAAVPPDATEDPAQFEAWQQFHEELLMHPRTLERAAGRFQRRGMDELARPEAVKTEIEPVLVHASNQPGDLTLEIRGPGREHTQRVLETYVTSIVAEANESRARRRDGYSTVVSDPATSGTEAIMDERPKYALMGLGGATAVAMVLWFGLWGAMSKRKAAFEASARLDEILADSRWVDPVPDVPRRAGSNTQG